MHEFLNQKIQLFEYDDAADRVADHVGQAAVSWYSTTSISAFAADAGADPEFIQRLGHLRLWHTPRTPAPVFDEEPAERTCLPQFPFVEVATVDPRDQLLTEC